MAAGIDFSFREGIAPTSGATLPISMSTASSMPTATALRRVPADGMFLMLKPVQNLIDKPISLFEQARKIQDFVDDYFAMEGWLNDNIPVPGEVFRQYVKYLYQQNLLGEEPVAGRQAPHQPRRHHLPAAEPDGQQGRPGPVQPEPAAQRPGQPHGQEKSSSSPPATSAWRSAPRAQRNSGRKPATGSKNAPIPCNACLWRPRSDSLFRYPGEVGVRVP